MISPLTTSLPIAPLSPGASIAAARATGGPSFADVLRSAVAEASRLQHDGAGAAERLQLGHADDVAGEMDMVEKGEQAFRTLLAIRDGLVRAYEEICNMPI